MDCWDDRSAKIEPTTEKHIRRPSAATERNDVGIEPIAISPPAGTLQTIARPKKGPRKPAGPLPAPFYDGSHKSERTAIGGATVHTATGAVRRESLRISEQQ